MKIDTQLDIQNDPAYPDRIVLLYFISPLLFSDERDIYTDQLVRDQTG